MRGIHGGVGTRWSSSSGAVMWEKDSAWVMID